MPGVVVAPLVQAHDRDVLLAAVAAEGWDLDLSDAVVAEGWENVALVSGEWIARFPRDESVDFATELEVLRLVDGRLPVPTPHVSHVGRLTRCLAYRRLDGFGWDREAYVRASDTQRQALATSCAAALAAMHALIDALPIATPTTSPTTGPTWLPELDPPIRHRVTGMIEELHERWSGTRSTVLLHNDFHLLNAVQAEPVGELVGLWDFSCVASGPPEVDLRYLEGSLISPWTESIALGGLHAHDQLRRVAGCYADSTGRELDLQLAILANRLENLEDLGPQHVARSLELWDAVDNVDS